MAPRIYPTPVGEGANSPEHRTGQSVDTVDQLSSVTLLGLAIGGAALALMTIHLIGG